MRQAFAVLFLFVMGSAQASSICADADFVNTCGNGTDDFDVNVAFTIELLPIFGGAIFATSFDGTLTQERDNWVNGGLYNGSVDTEITDLVATGGGMTWRVGVNQGVTATLGSIQQTSAGTADSVFNTFFEIDGTPFGTLHNNDPFVSEASISQIHPEFGALYIPPDSSPVALYDAGNTLVGHMTGYTMTVTTVSAVPVPAAVWLFGSGLGLLGWIRRRKTA